LFVFHLALLVFTLDRVFFALAFSCLFVFIFDFPSLLSRLPKQMQKRQQQLGEKEWTV
jgi:hypothetical protein